MLRLQDQSLRFFSVLDALVNCKSYVIDEKALHIQVPLERISCALDIPPDFGYANTKARFLKPLISHINCNSDLAINILEERRINRKIEYLVIGITSNRSTPSEILGVATQFIRNRAQSNPTGSK